jgi:signal transduction histidine kinase
MGLRPVSTAADAPLLRRTRLRLALWSGGATLATLIALGFLLYVAIDRSLVADSEQRLAGRAGEVQDEVQLHGAGALRFLLSDDGPVGRPQAGGPGAGTTTIVIQPTGRAFGLVPRELVNDLPVASGFQAARAGGVDIRNVSLAGTPFRVRSEPIRIGSERWILQILDNRAAEQRTLVTAVRVLVIGGIVVLIAALAFGFLYAGRALVPIRDSLRRQREFAADASHELRTPISVIRSSADYLRRQPALDDPAVASAVADIGAEGERMTRLVDELLLLARADSGAVEVRSERLDLTDVTGDALRGLARLAEERGVQVALEGEPVIVNGDPDRLQQVVAILVDNAVRHSPRGTTVRLLVARDGTGARVSVTDQGPGIRPEDLPRVFDRFFRAQGAPDGGSGLGLAIARWIAERHHGRLSAANATGGGAVFTLSLPAA